MGHVEHGAGVLVVHRELQERAVGHEGAAAAHALEPCGVIELAFHARVEALTPGEASELWSTVTDAVVAMKAAYRPEGINVGVNLGKPAGGSVSEHIHVHVVPRWTGDSNFMTATANTRTLPEALPDSAAKLRAHWPSHPEPPGPTSS